MEQVWIEILAEVPSLAVLVFLILRIARTLESFVLKFADAVRENTVAVREISVLVTKMLERTDRP